MQDNNNNTTDHQPARQKVVADMGLLAEVGAYLAEARQKADWHTLPYLVLCHESILLRPDGDLEYNGSYVIGRHATLEAAQKLAATMNDLARQYGYINLAYETVKIEPVAVSDLTEVEF